MQEAETRRNTVLRQPGHKSSQDLSQWKKKKLHMVEGAFLGRKPKIGGSWSRQI
jgi:hypothetical protein